MCGIQIKENIGSLLDQNYDGTMDLRARGSGKNCVVFYKCVVYMKESVGAPQC